MEDEDEQEVDDMEAKAQYEEEDRMRTKELI